MWEVQLYNFGRPNNVRFGRKTYDPSGLEVPSSRSNKYFGRARELPRIKPLFDELKPSKRAAQGKDQECKLNVEMRENADADDYGLNRDEADGPKEVESFRNQERAREEGASKGWTRISSGWVVSELDEVTECFVERRKRLLLQRPG